MGVKVLEQAEHWRIKEPRASSRGDHLEEYFPRDGRWQFNGDLERPTFTPSLNVRCGPFPDGRIEVNHFIVTDGKIAYCCDCTHEFAGQTLELADFTETEVALHEAHGQAE